MRSSSLDIPTWKHIKNFIPHAQHMALFPQHFNKHRLESAQLLSIPHRPHIRCALNLVYVPVSVSETKDCTIGARTKHVITKMLIRKCFQSRFQVFLQSLTDPIHFGTTPDHPTILWTVSYFVLFVHEQLLMKRNPRCHSFILITFFLSFHHS